METKTTGTLYQLSSDESHAISTAIEVAMEYMTPEQIAKLASNETWEKHLKALEAADSVELCAQDDVNLWRRREARCRQESLAHLWGKAMRLTGKKVEEVIEP